MLCENIIVVVIHCRSVESVSTLFDTDVQFDFVINCAAETKLGQSDAVRLIAPSHRRRGATTVFGQNRHHCGCSFP